MANIQKYLEVRVYCHFEGFIGLKCNGTSYRGSIYAPYQVTDVTPIRVQPRTKMCTIPYFMRFYETTEEVVNSESFSRKINATINGLVSDYVNDYSKRYGVKLDRKGITYTTEIHYEYKLYKRPFLESIFME